MPNSDPLTARLRRARLTVCGDFALDAHWKIAETSGPPSVETGLLPHRVETQRWELGGAARVAQHLSALRVQRVAAVGAVGRDVFGARLLALLDLPRVRSGALLRRNDWSTLAYGKPARAGVELKRLDFGTWHAPSAELRAALLHHLKAAVERSDVAILNQQVDPGLLCEATAEAVNELVATHPRTVFLADCRDRLAALRGVVAKCNAGEARALLATDEPEALELARGLAARIESTVFVTDGARGLAWASAHSSALVPAPALEAGIVTCGAGDAITAALGAALATGADAEQAARFAVDYTAAALRGGPPARRAPRFTRRAARSTS